MKKLLSLLILATMLLVTSCGTDGQGTLNLQSEADLAGYRVACTSGSVYDLMLSSRTDIEKSVFNSHTDCISALIQGHVDVYLDDDCTMPPDEMKRLGIRLAFRGKENFPCGFVFRKEGSSIRDSLSYFIDSLRATGELQQIYDRWFLNETPSKVPMPDLGPVPTGKPIVMGEVMDIPPLAFPVEKEWRGLEPELMERFSRYCGRPVKFKYIPMGSAVASLQAGNIEMFGGGIFITEERLKTLDFSSSHFNAHPGYFVIDNSNLTQSNFGHRMKQVIYNNLIVENRWRHITDGLWETLKISILSILLGSLIGAGICWMRMSRRKWICTIAKVYIDLMRGIPMLVFLMIMFYVVLSGMGLSATFVAVVAFALNFAAYVSEMFRTAILAVGKGQTEAGLALGLTRWQTFIHIIAPQALRNVMPVYKGEAISLVKNTSIVGYIAIQDLTRASDMIRNRTFDAFFPLLIVTILYFIIAWLLGKLLDLTVKSSTKK